MILTLTVGGEARALDLDSFRLSEADELLRLTGWDYDEWRDQLNKAHPDAIRFAWLLANRRHGTPLDTPFREIDFDLRDLGAEWAAASDDEEQVVDGAEGSDLPTGPAAA